MREIKFRVWDKECLCMETSKQNAVYFNGEMNIQSADWNIGDRYVLMQFTGKKDKNGKEIYEGDVIAGVNGSINGVDWDWGPLEIKFISCGFNVPLFGTFENNDRTHWFEVIGNIYENPELVAKEE